MSLHHQFSQISQSDECGSAESGASVYETAEQDLRNINQRTGNTTTQERWCQPSAYLAPNSDLTTKHTRHPIEHNLQDIRAHLPALMCSPILSGEQKLAILSNLPSFVLNNLYEHLTIHKLLRAPASSIPHGLNEETYSPLVVHDYPTPEPTAPLPIYPAYARHFTTSEQARSHRKRIRLPPKSQAPDVERVKRFGRQYWVHRIYDAMIDISHISDGDSSIHRQRFAESAIFDATDLEATAHHIFDSALAVHERGWNRPSVYHKKVVRGKLTDVSEKSLESRLARICGCLRQRKATVDDAVRGGVTLALLCDNPDARGFTKASNNMGNKKRGERLRLVNDQKAQLQRDKTE